MMKEAPDAFKMLVILVSLFLFKALVGCSTQSLMPSQKQVVSGKGLTENWDSYDKAMSFYDGIVPNQTTLAQLLKEQGVDFENSQNVEKLGPTAVRNFFLQNPSVKTDELPPGVQSCLNNYEDCRGYRIRKDVQNSKAVGSLFLRMLSFKREDEVTGWTIELLFLTKNDLIIYKEPLTGTPGGKAGSEMSKNPLGPAQEPLDKASKFAPRPGF